MQEHLEQGHGAAGGAFSSTSTGEATVCPGCVGMSSSLAARAQEFLLPLFSYWFLLLPRARTRRRPWTSTRRW